MKLFNFVLCLHFSLQRLKWAPFWGIFIRVIATLLAKKYINFTLLHALTKYCSWLQALSLYPPLLKEQLLLFYKKGVLKNFTKFTGKYLCQSLFFNKVAGLRQPLKNFKGYGLLLVFLSILWIFKKTFFIEHLRATFFRLLHVSLRFLIQWKFFQKCFKICFQQVEESNPRISH